MEVLVCQDAFACIAHTLLWIARPLPLLSPPHPPSLHSPTDPLAESVGTVLLKMLLLVSQATIFCSLFLFKAKKNNLCNSASFISCFTLLFNSSLHTVAMCPYKRCAKEDVKLLFLAHDDLVYTDTLRINRVSFHPTPSLSTWLCKFYTNIYYYFKIKAREFEIQH